MKDAFGTWFWVNLPASSFCSSQVSRCGEGQYRSPWQLQGAGWSGCGNEHGCSGGGVPKDPKVLSTLQRLRMFQDVWGIEVPTAIAIFRSSSKCLLLLIKLLPRRPRAIEKQDPVERGFQNVSPSMTQPMEKTGRQPPHPQSFCWSWPGHQGCDSKGCRFQL